MPPPSISPLTLSRLHAGNMVGCRGLGSRRSFKYLLGQWFSMFNGFAMELCLPPLPLFQVEIVFQCFPACARCRITWCEPQVRRVACGYCAMYVRLRIPCWVESKWYPQWVFFNRQLQRMSSLMDSVSYWTSPWAPRPSFTSSTNWNQVWILMKTDHLTYTYSNSRKSVYLLVSLQQYLVCMVRDVVAKYIMWGRLVSYDSFGLKWAKEREEAWAWTDCEGARSRYCLLDNIGWVPLVTLDLLSSILLGRIYACNGYICL